MLLRCVVCVESERVPRVDHFSAEVPVHPSNVSPLIRAAFSAAGLKPLFTLDASASTRSLQRLALTR